MGFPRVDACCCGCTVKTGSLILAWLGIIGSAISIFSFTALIGNPEIQKVAEKHPEAIMSRAEMYAQLSYAVIAFVMEFVLLAGIYKANETLIKMFVYYSYFGMIVAFIGFLLKLTVVPDKITYTVAFGIFYALGFYFLVVVRSHWLDVKETNQGVGKSSGGYV